MEVLEVDPDDDAAFAAWFAVHEAAEGARDVVGPGWQAHELRAAARASAAPDSPAPSLLLAAVREGATVGMARLDLPRADNPHLAELALLAVHPDARRAGTGTALLEAVVARAAGRRALVVAVDELPHEQGRSPGRAFALRHGFAPAQVDVRRDLLLPLDAARLDALEERCRPHAAGYALRTWEEHCPDDLVEDRALLGRRMSTDAPAGDVPRGEEEWDVARVRFAERLLREQGRARLSVGAVHEATGRLVAFTDLCVPLAVPERAYQWDTLVLREHRGSRLARWSSSPTCAGCRPPGPPAVGSAPGTPRRTRR